MDDKLLEPILVQAIKRIEKLENEHAKNETERRAAQRAWDHSYNRQDEMEVDLASLKNKIYTSGETQNGESQALRRICETRQRTIQQQQTSLAKMQVEIDTLKQYPRRVDDLDGTTLDIIDELDAQRKISEAVAPLKTIMTRPITLKTTKGAISTKATKTATSIDSVKATRPASPTSPQRPATGTTRPTPCCSTCDDPLSNSKLESTH